MNFSVLMAVHDEIVDSHLDLAMESIWTEQLLRPNQIVLVVDGKITDGKESVIEKWSKLLGKVMLLLRNKENLGLASSLNRGLAAAENDLIARMDADDVARADRFKKQIAHMSKDPDLAVCGSWVREFSAESNREHFRKTPARHEDILKYARYRSPMNHPTVVFRKSIIQKIGGYPLLDRAQDYALWIKLLNKGYLFHNLEEYLVTMRVDSDFHHRRGVSQLTALLSLFKSAKDEGFISPTTYIINVIIRVTICYSPSNLRRLMYDSLRNRF